MSDRTTSVPATQSQLTNNPAYDACIRDGYPESAARILDQQAEHGVSQADVDLELAFYGSDPELGPDVCEGIQVAAFRRDAGYTPRCAAELDAYSNSDEEWAAYQAANPAPTAVQVVAAQVQATAQDAEQAEQAAREECQQTLKAVVKAYRQGERAYRTGLLEAGRLVDVYIRGRLALGDVRANAVKAVEGHLAQYASSSVDAGRLALCYHAYRLLAVECGLEKAEMPYGHYRDHWCQLVERVNPNTATETYVLRPGMEAECKALFAAAVKDGLSREAVGGKVGGLLREYANRQEQARKALAEQAGKVAFEQQQAAYKATHERQVAEQQAKAAEEAAKAEQDAEQKAKLTAEMERQREELLAKQAAERKAVEEAAQAARAKAKAESDAKAAADAKAKADEKARKAADKAAQKATVAPPAEGATGTPTTVTVKPAAPEGGNLLRAAKAGTVKDVAGMAVELVTGGDAPDDVLAELLRLLDGHKELSKQSQRAIQAARLVLDKASRQVTVTLPSTGGTVESNGHATVGAA